MQTTIAKNFRLRSFVRRDSRRTAAQERAYAELNPQFGLQMAGGMIAYPAVFGRKAACFLEIGFGSGQSLLALAHSRPDLDFIGVETHKPGIGALYLGIQQSGVSNLRIYDADVIDVFEKCIPDNSFDGIQIFFPDPWPKRRHHARRLVQPSFIHLVADKLKPAGTLHMATDWEDYAIHMQRVMSSAHQFTNLAGEHQFAERSPYRPIVTKFERRAAREGRSVWELQFQKQANHSE